MIFDWRDLEIWEFYLWKPRRGGVKLLPLSTLQAL